MKTMKIKIIFVLLLLLVYSIFSLGAYGKSNENSKYTESPWPMAHHDAMHTGVARCKSSQNAGRIIWKYHTPNASKIMGGDGIVIDSNGSIYFYADDHYLYSISSNGTFRWKYPVENTSYLIGGPVVSQDGVYFLNNPGIPSPLSNISPPTYLFLLSYNGTLQSKIRIDYCGSPIVFNGSVYIGTKEGIYRINGSDMESVISEVKCTESIAIDGSGNLYAVVNDTIYMFTLDGNLKWTYKMPNVVMDDLVIGYDGTVYSYVFRRGLYAISSEGKLKWFSTVSGPIKGKLPAISGERLYITTEVVDGSQHISAYLYSVSTRDGNVIWKTKLCEVKNTASVVPTSPIVGGDGNIYVGIWYTRNDTGYFYSITPDGKIIWKLRLDGGVITEPAIGRDGTIYVGTTKGMIYAIGGTINESDNEEEPAPMEVEKYYLLGGGIIAATSFVCYLWRRKKNDIHKEN